MAKEFVNVNGNLIKMNEAAYQIAKEHFGAMKTKVPKELPIELIKLPPRIEIIKAKEPELQVPEVPEVIEVKAEELKGSKETKQPEEKVIKRRRRR